MREVPGVGAGLPRQLVQAVRRPARAPGRTRARLQPRVAQLPGAGHVRGAAGHGRHRGLGVGARPGRRLQQVLGQGSQLGHAWERNVTPKIQQIFQTNLTMGKLTMCPEVAAAGVLVVLAELSLVLRAADAGAQIGLVVVLLGLATPPRPRPHSPQLVLA